MTKNTTKRHGVRLAILLLTLAFLLASCSAPPPDDTKALQTPQGAVALDMTRKQIETLYAMEYELDMEGGVLDDYGPIVVIYDLNGNAISVRAFEPGITTSTGVEVGMAYADVLAKSPDWAEEITVKENPAIRIAYQGKGEKPTGNLDDADYFVLYRFADGVVERVIIAYPGFTTED